MKTKMLKVSSAGLAFGLAIMLSYALGAQQREASNATTTATESQVEPVTGIGGVFFKAKDPKGMAAWYRNNLGIKSRGGYADFTWRDKEHPEEIGHTTWAIFPTNSTQFGQSASALMINY